jgi:hypothetical protein
MYALVSCRPARCLTVFEATFRELGPPDLCHVVKSTGKAGTRDVSPRFSFSVHC